MARMTRWPGARRRCADAWRTAPFVALIADNCVYARLMSATGTFETCRTTLKMSVYVGRTEVFGAGQTGAIDPKQTSDTLAILSGRRRSAAAKLGWIVVARGLVLEDRRKAP